MKKISILISNEASKLGLYYGFWNWFYFYENELKKLGIKFKFFNKINSEFLKSDYLFLNSRYFKLKNGFVELDEIKKIQNINNNIYWFDMRDSAGTTQFEVLPFVKKYIKKSYYKNKNLYSTKLNGGRYYTDFYINKYQVKDTKEYKMKLLDKRYEFKLVLGWNIGVAFFFNYLKYSSFDYYKELLSCKFFKKKLFSKKLNFQENWNIDNKKTDVFCLMNKKFSRESVSFQRNLLQNNLSKLRNITVTTNVRQDKKKYYETLINSKVSTGAYGWGEVCYREFEAIRCGTAFMFPNMSHIETWPNIYLEDTTYISYDLDFNNFEEKINELIFNLKLRKKLVSNSQEILQETHAEIGKNYFLNKVIEIIS